MVQLSWCSLCESQCWIQDAYVVVGGTSTSVVVKILYQTEWIQDPIIVCCMATLFGDGLCVCRRDIVC